MNMNEEWFGIVALSPDEKSRVLINACPARHTMF